MKTSIICIDRINLIKKYGDERVGPVASTDVEEGIVSVREVSGSNDMHPQVPMLSQDKNDIEKKTKTY